MHTTGTPEEKPKHRFPACPTTADDGMWGRSRYGIFTRSVRVPANAPSPLPRTTPTRGSMVTRLRMANTQSSRRAAIDEGGAVEMGGMASEHSPAHMHSGQWTWDHDVLGQLAEPSGVPYV